MKRINNVDDLKLKAYQDQVKALMKEFFTALHTHFEVVEKKTKALIDSR